MMDSFQFEIHNKMGILKKVFPFHSFILQIRIIEIQLILPIKL